MPNIILPPSWRLNDRDVTSESDYVNRREFIRRTGLFVAGMSLGAFGCGDTGTPAGGSGSAVSADEIPESVSGSPKPTGGPAPVLTAAPKGLYPAKRNKKYVLDRAVTPASVAAKYNNFYEFTTDKSGVWRLAKAMKTQPWTVGVTGLVKKPKTWDLNDLLKKVALEERLYRFRCVETWAMAVPWTGFRLADLVKLAEPKSGAKYVKLVTKLDKKTMPGIGGGYPWPYTEALTMAEATNELTLLATGIYGKPLPNQHGAPLRLVVPWKYGFKNVKSIVRIEFTDERPATFWNTAAGKEYGFYANINPKRAHPRWSQASEQMIGTRKRFPTLLYNGYGEQVAGLYKDLKVDHYF